MTSDACCACHRASIFGKSSWRSFTQFFYKSIFVPNKNVTLINMWVFATVVLSFERLPVCHLYTVHLFTIHICYRYLLILETYIMYLVLLSFLLDDVFNTHVT